MEAAMGERAKILDWEVPERVTTLRLAAMLLPNERALVIGRRRRDSLSVRER
jgi:hypothetical protein